MPKPVDTCPAASPLLDVQDLRIRFAAQDNRAVDGVNFLIQKGRTVAIAGRSGSGKSVTAMALTRLLPKPPAIYESGRVVFEGRDLFAMDERQLRAIRGAHIAYVFQEPASALNPVVRVGPQVEEAVRVHNPKEDPKSRALEMLRMVGLSDPEHMALAYPHHLSGGMQQRVVMAMALACRPSLLIADEPTTALDVTVQAQILDLLVSLQERLHMAILLITHNLAIAGSIADEIHIMLDGRFVESGPPSTVLLSPKHPYTRMLIEAIPEPSFHAGAGTTDGERL
jgi:ABC-type dipeptide/oligopeptide/nickel transport system ATPase component